MGWVCLDLAKERQLAKHEMEDSMSFKTIGFVAAIAALFLVLACSSDDDADSGDAAAPAPAPAPAPATYVDW